MDPPLLVSGLMGAVWALPGACFGLLLGGAATGGLLGRPQALWGALLGTICGGVLACTAIVTEFRRDLALDAMLLGAVLVPLGFAVGLARQLWNARRRPLSDVLDRARP
jgi:hypothetical protein